MSIFTAFTASHPAYILTGPMPILLTTVHNFLQEQFCLNSKCGICVTCKQLFTHQHYALRWYAPGKQYTLELIDELLANMSFMLDAGQRCFIVLQNAHTLSAACANRLLKSMEEPPAGYYLLLLTPSTQILLPTIISRCLVQQVQGTTTVHNHPLLNFFLEQAHNYNPLAFVQALDKSGIYERESIELVEQLYQTYSERYRTALLNNNQTQADSAQPLLTLLEKTMEQPPMSGGSKIFWRNLFIQWNAYKMGV
jgi:hypothetical protein